MTSRVSERRRLRCLALGVIVVTACACSSPGQVKSSVRLSSAERTVCSQTASAQGRVLPTVLGPVRTDAAISSGSKLGESANRLADRDPVGSATTALTAALSDPSLGDDQVTLTASAHSKEIEQIRDGFARVLRACGLPVRAVPRPPVGLTALAELPSATDHAGTADVQVTAGSGIGNTRGSGYVDFRHTAVRLALTDDTHDHFVLVRLADHLWVHDDSLVKQLPRGDTWIELSQSAFAGGAPDVPDGTMALNSVRALMGQLRPLKLVGPELVDKKLASHFEGTLDPKKVAAALADTSIQHSNPATVDADAWLDDHGRLLRFEFAGHVDVKDMPTPVGYDVTLSFSHFGDVQRVTPPPDDKVAVPSDSGTGQPMA